MKNSIVNKQLALVILDGMGETKKRKGNACYYAKTPNLDKLKKNYPTLLLNASGKYVGLPYEQMGNSEIGHLNIGSGRISPQLSSIIINDIANNVFENKKEIKEIINLAKKQKSHVHIIGLISDGGVHGHIDHLLELIKVFKKNDVDYFLHAISDGRDSEQKSVLKYLDILKRQKINIASLAGRYYAMDRDQRWDRTTKAFNIIAYRKGESFLDVEKYVKSQYEKGIYDEFIVPAFNQNNGWIINDKDIIVLMNFRQDRARQISHLFIGSNEKITNFDYEGNYFKRKKVSFYTLTEYAGIKSKFIYPQVIYKEVLGEILAKYNISQLRAAETEKYPHVTFFFDGGDECNFIKEKRILVPSPKIATYDLKPEMSSVKLTDEILKFIDDYDVSIINYAQPDMVGHTGNMNAAIKAVESADEAVGRLYQKIVVENEGIMLITSDHGNVETMISKDNLPMTTHTNNPVKLIVTSNEFQFKEEYKKNLQNKLSDIAPTMLFLLNISKPKRMTGNNLLEKVRFDNSNK